MSEVGQLLPSRETSPPQVCTRCGWTFRLAKAETVTCRGCGLKYTDYREPDEPVDLGPIIPEEGIDLRAMLALIEKETIREALSKCSSLTETARLLSISRPALDYKMKTHGLRLGGSES